MAGGIFEPCLTENLEEWDVLTCYLCKQPFDVPYLLQCLHTFCQSCLSGRISHGKLTCPICGEETQTENNCDLTDTLLTAVAEINKNSTICCANCEKERDDMVFCNTCTQPMCSACRHATHTAKMFASHQIVELSRAIPDSDKYCDEHKEPLVLFSTQQDCALCVKCFQKLSEEEKCHCVDIDAAFCDIFKALEDILQNLKKLQEDTISRIEAQEALLEEQRTHAQAECDMVKAFGDKLIQAIAEQRDGMIQDINRDLSCVEELISVASKRMACNLPVLHQVMKVSAKYKNITNKYSFMSHAQRIVARCSTLHEKKQPIPAETKPIPTHNYREKYQRTLEAFFKCDMSQSVVSTRNRGTQTKSVPKQIDKSETRSSPEGQEGQSSSPKKRRSSPQGPAILANGSSFLSHCSQFDKSHKSVVQLFEGVKQQLQDLQRDFTQRRCLSKQGRVDGVFQQCQGVQEQINEHVQAVQLYKEQLEQNWEGTLQQLSIEQKIYNEQLLKASSVKEECEQLLNIATKLLPFIKSISGVAERIAPELEESHRKEDKKDQMSALFEQISTIHPDSVHRVDAIKSAEEERQTQIANRVNPLDHELQKTKEQLKSPSLRHHRGATPNKDARGDSPNRDIEGSQRVSTEGEPQGDVEECSKEKQDDNVGLPKLSGNNKDIDLDVANVSKGSKDESDSAEIDCAKDVKVQDSELSCSTSANDGANNGVAVNAHKDHWRHVKGKKPVEKRNSWTADSNMHERVNTGRGGAHGQRTQRGSSHEPDLENIRDRLMNDIKTFENSSLHKTAKD